MLKHLKMACLGYSQGKIKYRDQQFEQDRLNYTRDKLLVTCQDLMKNASVFASESLAKNVTVPDIKLLEGN